MFDTKKALLSFEKLTHQQKIKKLLGVTKRLKKIPSFKDMYDYLNIGRDSITDEILVGYYQIILGMISVMQDKELSKAKEASTKTKKVFSSAKYVEEKDILEAESMIHAL